MFRTLDEIKADGTVNIGVFSDKNPFGYVDENGEYQGYDVYFARRLAEDLGVEAFPALKGASSSGTAAQTVRQSLFCRTI